MVVWLSKPLQSQRGWTTACLKAQANKPLTHDNLFHSVLGLAQVGTALAQPAQDIFAACSAAR